MPSMLPIFLFTLLIGVLIGMVLATLTAERWNPGAVARAQVRHSFSLYYNRNSVATRDAAIASTAAHWNSQHPQLTLSEEEVGKMVEGMTR